MNTLSQTIAHFLRVERRGVRLGSCGIVLSQAVLGPRITVRHDRQDADCWMVLGENNEKDQSSNQGDLPRCGPSSARLDPALQSP